MCTFTQLLTTMQGLLLIWYIQSLAGVVNTQEHLLVVLLLLVPSYHGPYHILQFMILHVNHTTYTEKSIQQSISYSALAKTLFCWLTFTRDSTPPPSTWTWSPVSSRVPSRQSIPPCSSNCSRCRPLINIHLKFISYCLNICGKIILSIIILNRSWKLYPIASCMIYIPVSRPYAIIIGVHSTDG